MGTESTLETFAQMKFHEDKIRNQEILTITCEDGLGPLSEIESKNCNSMLISKFLWTISKLSTNLGDNEVDILRLFKTIKQ